MDKAKAFVFHGTRPYGIHIAVAYDLADACRLVGIKVEECREFLAPFKREKPYEYEVLEAGDVKDYGE